MPGAMKFANLSRLSLVTAGLAFALNLAAQESPRIQFKGAQAFTEFGNIVNGLELSTDTLDNMWVQRFGGTFDLQASNGGNLDIYFGTGSIFWHAIPAIGNQSASKVFYGDAILTKAFAQFRFGEAMGDGENPLVVGKLGFFPVKYSPSKNLGEYLFRTGTYPSFLVTGNGYTAVNTVNTGSTQVLGTQWTHHLSPAFSHDLFFTSESSLTLCMIFHSPTWLVFKAPFSAPALEFSSIGSYRSRPA